MAARRQPPPDLVADLAGEWQPHLREVARKMEAKHPPTWAHMVNVGLYAGVLARQLGLTAPDVQQVQLVGLLHDVGKLGIPQAILTKAGPLDHVEAQIMIRHAELGEQILDEITGLTHLARPVRHHHEWYNGRGYPDRLQGPEIPLASRIVAVADAYDTMTTPRPYRKPLRVLDALGEIRRCAGTQFDPDVARAFADLVEQAWRSQADWLNRLSRANTSPEGSPAITLAERRHRRMAIQGI